MTRLVLLPLFGLAAVLVAGCSMRDNQIHACTLQADARHPFHPKSIPQAGITTLANQNDFNEVKNQIVSCMQEAGYTLIVSPDKCPYDAIRNLDDLNGNCFVLAGGESIWRQLGRMLSSMS